MPSPLESFISDLSNTIEACTKDAEGVQRSLASSKRASAAEIVNLSSTICGEVKQLNGQLPQLVGLSRGMPRSSVLLDAAFAHLAAVDAVLDQFEARLESAYGIQPVVVPEETGPLLADVADIYSGDSVSKMTPPRAAEPPPPPVDTMPVTPRLEDFGISDEALQNDLKCLGLGSISRLASGSAGSSQTPNGLAELGVYGGARGVLDGGDIGMLGIETPVQVEEKFESRRREAVAAMIARSSPVVQAGVERRLDYSGLADGYYDDCIEGEGMEERVGKACELVRENYDGMAEFVKKSNSLMEIEEAAMVLVQSGDRVFAESALRELWADMGKRNYNRLLLAMSQGGVLKGEGKGVYALQV